MTTTRRESTTNRTRPPRREEMRSRSRQRSPRRDRTRSRPRRQSPGRQTTAVTSFTTPISTKPMIPTHQKKHSYGYHPSLVAGLTLFFIILIIAVAVTVKICLHRRRKTTSKGSTEKQHSKRISSYKMYSEVDQSVFLADRVSEVDVKHLRGPEDDSIDEYLKKHDDSQDNIDFQNSGPNLGDKEVKYDYPESPKDQQRIECKTGSVEFQYDYATHPTDKDSENGTGSDNGRESPVMNRTDNEGYFVLEKQQNT